MQQHKQGREEEEDEASPEATGRRTIQNIDSIDTNIGTGVVWTSLLWDT